jgi:hypothetical protein
MILNSLCPLRALCASVVSFNEPPPFNYSNGLHTKGTAIGC